MAIPEEALTFCPQPDKQVAAYPKQPDRAGLNGEKALLDAANTLFRSMAPAAENEILHSRGKLDHIGERFEEITALLGSRRSRMTRISFAG